TKGPEVPVPLSHGGPGIGPRRPDGRHAGGEGEHEHKHPHPRLGAAQDSAYAPLPHVEVLPRSTAHASPGLTEVHHPRTQISSWVPRRPSSISRRKSVPERIFRLSRQTS